MGPTLEKPVTRRSLPGGLRDALAGAGRHPRLQRISTLIKLKYLILGIVILIVVWLGAGPLGFLIWKTLSGSHGLSFDAFRRAYDDTGGISRLLSNTALFTVGSVVIALIIGTGLAFLTERTDIPFKKSIFTLAIVPLVIPGVLYTIAWIFLAAPRVGIYNHATHALFGFDIINIYSTHGMVLVQGLDSVPLCYLLMVAAFRSTDPSLEESAAMSGASLWRVIYRISIPLARPGIYAAALILAVRTLGSFEVPTLLGVPQGIWLITSRIYNLLSEEPLDVGAVGALSLILFVICAFGIFAYSRLSKRARRFQTVSGKGFRRGRLPLGHWRYPILVVVCIYFLIAFVVPCLIIIYMSTQPYYSTPSLSTLSHMSLSNYAYIFGEGGTFGALGNSVLVGVCTATITMLLAGIGSWFVVRTRTRGRQIVDQMAFVPMVFPGLVLGIAILFIYTTVPIHIYGTIWILLVGYVTIGLPYGMRYASTSLYQISNELEESAEVCGATWWQMFRRVTLPLLRPGLLAGWIFVFMVSMKELAVPVVLYQPGSEVLSNVVWTLWTRGLTTQVSALGVVMIALLGVIALLLRLVGKGTGSKAAW